MEAATSANPFLQGNYAPIRSEDDFDLEIEGAIPRELRGALLRIGPNPQFEPRDPRHHWFIGDGMVHGFYVENGAVRYRNRYVRTSKWQDEHAAGRSLFGSFGNPMTTDPTVLGRDFGAANTNIVFHGGKLVALEEAHPPMQMDPQTLQTIGYVQDYQDRFTAHPKIDPQTGDMVWFAYNTGAMPFSRGLSYGETSPAGDVWRRDDLEAPFCSMIHDFMVTKNHVMIPVLPLTGSLERAMSGRSAFAWEPDKGGHVGVLPRKNPSAAIRWFTVNACYVFHPLNAWEEGDTLYADVMRYDAAPLFPQADGSAPVASTARLVRWTFDLTGTNDVIKEAPLDDVAGEFPRVDPRVETRRHRHAWFAADPLMGGDGPAGLAHLDLATGRRQRFELPPGDRPSEPVFVPRTATADEGDGWITSVIWRAAENRSDLAVFNACDIAKGPIALARLPRRIPFGFHGNWLEME